MSATSRLPLRGDPSAVPPDGLKQLVYVSRVAPGPRPEGGASTSADAVHDEDLDDEETPLDAGALSEILRVARARNKQHGVTGLLLHFPGRFLQYLEGAPGVVDDTFARIRRDARHQQVEVLLEQPTAARRFATWDMGVMELGTDEWLLLAQADWPTLEALPVLPTLPANPSARRAPNGLAALDEIAARLQAVPVASPHHPRRLVPKRQVTKRDVLLLVFFVVFMLIVFGLGDWHG